MTTLQEIVDDIWHMHGLGYYIAIPTNGFVKNNGECVMGRGLALQASINFPSLSKELGNIIKCTRARIGESSVTLFETYKIITFPVKMNWWERASFELIETSCVQLVDLVNVKKLRTPIFLPRVGTGNGRLRWPEVKPRLEKYLDARFIVCNY